MLVVPVVPASKASLRTRYVKSEDAGGAGGADDVDDADAPVKHMMPKPVQSGKVAKAPSTATSSAQKKFGLHAYIFKNITIAL